MSDSDSLDSASGEKRSALADAKTDLRYEVESVSICTCVGSISMEIGLLFLRTDGLASRIWISSVGPGSRKTSFFGLVSTRLEGLVGGDRFVFILKSEL